MSFILTDVQPVDKMNEMFQNINMSMEQPYRLPERFDWLERLHHGDWHRPVFADELWDGDIPTAVLLSLDFWLHKHSSAMIADLIALGFRRWEIEMLVNDGKIDVAPWPEQQPRTHLFWHKSEKVIRRNNAVAELVTEMFEYLEAEGIHEAKVIDIVRLVHNWSFAIEAVVIGRHQGLLREIPNPDPKGMPLYQLVEERCDETSL